MQEYLADLHIHSRFSRATSSRLNLPLLAAWARLKGLSVLGTGDFTHPAWRSELRKELVFDAASGLYALADESALAGALPQLPVAAPAMLRPGAGEDASGLSAPPIRFMLQGEISSIYKRGGKVRKVHNLVFMPTLEAAEDFSLRLAKLGNITSDGRPILGLDSRDLLEMVLESHPDAFLIPAHIWTPWFSLFGSKSGFNSLEDCFGDLSGEIFALETGLSSDPAMNRLWSALDAYRLVSNSDAHSGENLGREANLFSGQVSYKGMLKALKYPEAASETSFLGTLEFFPEEGKYHMDGHRKCNIVLSPEETRALGGLCPVCGGPLTVGVFNRVMELSDRDEPVYGPGDGALGRNGFMSLVPLAEILGEVLGVGPKTRRVGDMYARALERFGPELTILRQTPVDDLCRFSPPLGEAVGRMRRGEVCLEGGYDGEYGAVRMFTDAERRDILRGMGKTGRGVAAVEGLALPGTSPPARGSRKRKKEASGGSSSAERQESDPAPDCAKDEDFLFSSLNAPGIVLPPEGDAPEALAQEEAPCSASGSGVESGKTVPADTGEAKPGPAEDDMPSGLNAAQEHAVLAGPGPVLVLAGPGTGKTKTLVARALSLLDEGISARRILAVTFTRRAASEMDARLASALPENSPLPRTDTLHALALELWHKVQADMPVLLGEEGARRVFTEANPEESAQTLREAWQAVNLARERMESPSPEYAEIGRRYHAQKSAWNLADYTDLLEFWLERINDGLYHSTWGHVLVDEVQDLSPLQLTLVRCLVPSSGEGFFGIGDPDQSIYGFRGAYGDCEAFFRAAWPGLERIRLTLNYRSCQGVLLAAHAVLHPAPGKAAAADSLKAATGGTAAPQAKDDAGPLPLTAIRTEPAAIIVFDAPSAEAEAVWIADKAASFIGLGSHTLADANGDAADHSPGDIAVLVRTHALAAVYRKFLHRKGLPVTEPAADAFWADERVDLILRAAGRMLGIAVAEENGTEIPPCPDKIFANGPLGVAAYFSAFPPFDALFWHSSAFRSLVKAYDANNGWAGLLTWISLQTELELVRAKGEKIQIMSLHAAKGLEFRTVFLPCLEDGIMPFAGPNLLTGKLVEKNAAGHMDEERRLLYVGMTRAKDNLYLSRAAKRVLYGRELRLKASRFLEAVPEELAIRSTLVATATRKEEQLNLL